GDLDGEQPDGILARRWQALVQPRPVEEQVVRHRLVVRRVNDAGDREAPVAGKDLADERDRVADLPTESLRQPFADDAGVALGDEVLRTALLEAQIEDLQRGLRLDREVGEEVLAVLVVAAEPV